MFTFLFIIAALLFLGLPVWLFLFFIAIGSTPSSENKTSPYEASGKKNDFANKDPFAYGFKQPDAGPENQNFYDNLYDRIEDGYCDEEAEILMDEDPEMYHELYGEDGED